MLAIISDSPALTTGFGRTTRRIADALYASGRDIACFGFKARREDNDPSIPYLIWPAEQGDHWTTVLPGFFAATMPAAVLVNGDSYNAVEVITAVRSVGYQGPIISYVVFDGLPVGTHYLDLQRSCDVVIASSHTAATYLRSNGVKVAGVAPPGVDTDEFRIVPNRPALRAQAGVTDALVIGVFGINSERKQIAKVIAALPEIQNKLAPTKVILYLHCREVGFWRLADVARDLGVGDQVFFPTATPFDERRGVPTVAVGERLGETREIASIAIPSEFSYVDRLNLCDVIVNVPYSGDIEQVILEAQACGVPLVHTDDKGIMAEAVGIGGLLIPATDVGVGRAGEQIQHVAIADIATSVAKLLRDTEVQEMLRRHGLSNASRYPWTVLESEVCRVVSAVLERQGA